MTNMDGMNLMQGKGSWWFVQRRRMLTSSMEFLVDLVSLV